MGRRQFSSPHARRRHAGSRWDWLCWLQRQLQTTRRFDWTRGALRSGLPRGRLHPAGLLRALGELGQQALVQGEGNEGWRPFSNQDASHNVEAGDPTGAVYEGEREIGVFREFATLLSAMCVVSRLDGCTDAQKTDLKPYLSMPITRLRSQVVTFEMDMAKLREELARAESEYELARTSSELKRNEANVKAAQDLRKKFEEAQGHVDALENDLGQGYRMAKSVLLFRSHEQHVLGSGWMPRSTGSWGSLNSRSSSRSSRYDLKDEV